MELNQSAIIHFSHFECNAVSIPSSGFQVFWHGAITVSWIGCAISLECFMIKVTRFLVFPRVASLQLSHTILQTSVTGFRGNSV